MPRDVNFISTKAGPTNGSNVDTTAFDTGLRPGQSDVVPYDVDLDVAWGQMAESAGNKTLTFTLQDSADNITFTSLGITYQISSGAVTKVFASGSKRFRIPATARQYVSVNIALESGADDLDSELFTTALIFKET